MNRYVTRVRELEGEIVSSDAQFTPLSEGQLKEVEALLGFSLPNDYREFISQFGGVSFLRGATFAVAGNEDDYGSVELFYGIDSTNLSEGLVGEYLMWRDSFVRWPIELVAGIRLVRSVSDDEKEVSWPKQLLPIGMDAGDNQICLALSGSRTGAIFFWNNTPFPDEQNVYLIANSFDEFINALYLRD